MSIFSLFVFPPLRVIMWGTTCWDLKEISSLHQKSARSLERWGWKNPSNFQFHFTWCFHSAGLWYTLFTSGKRVFDRPSSVILLLAVDTYFINSKYVPKYFGLKIKIASLKMIINLFSVVVRAGENNRMVLCHRYHDMMLLYHVKIYSGICKYGIKWRSPVLTARGISF